MMLVRSVIVIVVVVTLLLIPDSALGARDGRQRGGTTGRRKRGKLQANIYYFHYFTITIDSMNSNLVGNIII